MYRFILLIMSILCIVQLSVCASDYSTYYNNDNYYQESNTYCAPKESILTKIKNNFIGLPTGYTPQIEPSPYINNFGPSYMRGFYGRNGWADHNIYSPAVSGIGAHILD